MFKTKRRLIEEYEDKMCKALFDLEDEKDKEMQEALDKRDEQCKKALELQQAIYDEKIKNLTEIAKTSYHKGRNEVLDLVKKKMLAGELLLVKRNKNA